MATAGSRSGIVLGRERTFFDNSNKKKETLHCYTVTKLRKNNVGKQLTRMIKLRVEGDSIVGIFFIHPEKPQKSFETPISDLIDVNISVKERRVRINCKDQTDFTRFAFHHENDLDDFRKYMEQTNVPCTISHPVKERTSSEAQRETNASPLQSGWKKTETSQRIERKQYEEQIEAMVRWEQDIHILGVTETIKHQSAVRLFINVSCSTYDLLLLAVDRLVISDSEEEILPTDYGLIRSQIDKNDSCINPENRIDIYHSSVLSNLLLQRQTNSQLNNKPERIAIKVLIPELHSSKVIQFNARIPILRAMKEMHSTSDMFASSIPKDTLKYYSFFLSSQTTPLDNNKPLNFYNIREMETVTLKRPAVYEFSQNHHNASLILRADVTVREAVREFIRWAKPEIYGNPHHYGLMLVEFEKKQNLERRIWISDTDQLSTYKIHPQQQMHIQCRRKRLLDADEKKPRIVIVESCPAIMKSIEFPTERPSKTMFQCALGNENSCIVLHIPDGRKEVLLFSETIEEIAVAEKLVKTKKKTIRITGELILTNYQLLWIGPDVITRIPLGSIERIETNSSTLRTSLASSGSNSGNSTITIDCKIPVQHVFTMEEEYLALTHSLTSIAFKNTFAYLYRESFRSSIEDSEDNGWNIYHPLVEFERQGLARNKKWRYSEVNRRFKFCPSYPNRLFVPSFITDEILEEVGQFRSKARIPVLTYLHSNGNPICRASQPLVGIQNRRSDKDEELLDGIRLAGASGRLIVYDARPKINAIANQAKGAGYENTDKGYFGCEIKFLDIDNIHAIRNSYRTVRDLGLSLESRTQKQEKKKKESDQKLDTWHLTLANSHWFEYIRLILRGAIKVVHSITNDNSSVLIHCSDGWDRTAQLAALAELMLDPFYRTIIGFEVLIEKDWLSFGHRFERRFGHANRQYDDGQRAPIFFQFLDCVFQLLHQFPTSFEFNSKFLMEIAHHTVSLRFGTFLFDTEGLRREKNLKETTVSLWSYMNGQVDKYMNVYYVKDNKVIIPSANSSHLRFWDEFFLQGQQQHEDFSNRHDSCVAQAAQWREENIKLKQELERLAALLEKANIPHTK